MAKKMSMTDAVRKFADAMGSALDQRSIVTQCVNACASHFQGETPDSKSVKEFADGVAELRDWTPASERARKSEVRNIVRNYDRLPGLCDKIAAKADTFTWHNAIKVARLCKGRTDTQVVTAYFESKPSKRVTPTKKIDKALETVLETVTTSAKYKKFQTELEKLLAKHKIAVSIE